MDHEAWEYGLRIAEEAIAIARRLEFACPYAVILKWPASARGTSREERDAFDERTTVRLAALLRATYQQWPTPTFRDLRKLLASLRRQGSPVDGLHLTRVQTREQLARKLLALPGFGHDYGNGRDVIIVTSEWYDSPITTLEDPRPNWTGT